MLTKKEKEELLKDTDSTGSASSQVILLSEKIKKLFTHLKENSKDIHSKRGLLRMVNKRKKLLNYIKEDDEKEYKELIKKIGLKK